MCVKRFIAKNPTWRSSNSSTTYLFATTAEGTLGATRSALRSISRKKTPLNGSRITVHPCMQLPSGCVDKRNLMGAFIPSVPRIPEISPLIRCSRRGSCVPAALYCLPQLVEGRDFILEGWISFGSSGRLEHTWMQADGVRFDPTIIQFRRFGEFSAGPLYQPAFIMPPSQYRDRWVSQKSLWWRERVQLFGVPATNWAFA